MSVTLEIPDDFAQPLQTERAQAEAQLHLELAIALYREGKLPPGRAAEIAGLSRWEFEDILRQRQVAMPYTVADLEHDLAYAGGRRFHARAPSPRPPRANYPAPPSFTDQLQSSARSGERCRR